ncbi:conjugal transfer protein [Escherichia coli]|uniref:conjugal transfer protein n=1 Tax=Escherichia coli TaxID=562 RepID=UPI0018E8BEE7|nr:conjugal transfer protein [Escherichia coli]MBJ1846541.1 conjugal transfer protein [Escherichia coli]MBJ2058093.1 conjugal transfer protein [Escherichia coli]HDI9002112.1 conjugal transfer protein [Escherichia coli]
MNMKKTLLVILTSISLASPAAVAASCRAGAAAEAGSKAAWERARTASQAWSQRENDVASSLQSCLSRIKDVSITLPQFPSLDKILRDLENQVCDAVVDRVNEHLPGNIDPWKDYNL